MDVLRLEIFMKLCRNLHFSKTASELGMAQSVLSHQITLLEKEWGYRLFERSNRWNVTLTPAGAELYSQARLILNTVQTVRDKVQAAARGENGILNIALNSSALNGNILLKTFHKMRIEHPGISLSIREEPSKKVYEMVRSGEADVGLLRLFPSPDDDCEMRLVTQDALVMAMPKYHPLATKEGLHFRDFRNECFILPSREDAPLHRSVFDQLCNEAGFSPLIDQELESQTTILRILESRNCVSLVPKAYKKLFDHLVFRSTTEGLPSLPETAIWLKDSPSQVLKTFLKELFPRK